MRLKPFHDIRPIRKIRLENEPQHSICTISQARAFVQDRLRPLLTEYDIIEVRRGILDRSSIDIHNTSMQGIASVPVGAGWHVHEIRYAFVPSAENAISTIAAGSIDCARGTLSALENQSLALLRKNIFLTETWHAIAPKQPKVGSLQLAMEYLRAGLGLEYDKRMMRNERDPHDAHSFLSRGLHEMYLLYMQNQPVAKDALYPFIQHVQRDTPNIVSLDWHTTDIGVINTIHHGRDVRTHWNRRKDERLFQLEAIPQ